jgi:hypothetical protein
VKEDAMSFRIFSLASLAAFALVALTGCVSTFTGIERQPDNSYYLTQVKQGPFFVAGSAFKCVPLSEAVMRCQRVAVP